MTSPKTSLLAGGNSGIGHATLNALLADGHRVVAALRDREKMAAAESLETVEFDARNAAAELVLPEVIDGLVYFPDTITLKSFRALKDDDFLKDMEINSSARSDLFGPRSRRCRRPITRRPCFSRRWRCKPGCLFTPASLRPRARGRACAVPRRRAGAEGARQLPRAIANRYAARGQSYQRGGESAGQSRSASAEAPRRSRGNCAVGAVPFERRVRIYHRPDHRRNGGLSSLRLL